ncbi:MAG TPA: hypothetical protein VN946_07360 [Terriglobales bacterium]|jgi:hypothetical protein|nr:hypothetical protein [Terriglobales bacterium]
MATVSLTTPQKTIRTGEWAVKMAKVRIRQALARTRWQLVTFWDPQAGNRQG